ncbi:MAG: hypothetical protein NT091_00450 [Candidatus Falkowbacteria bacterium]|nr:hypothetical protein [Candidatus Falkowbacteria bacterium]
MVQDTNDILRLAMTFGVIWVAISLGLMFLYIALTVREMFLITKETRARFRRVDKAITELHRKITDGASGVMHIIEGVKMLITAIKDRKKKKRSAK